MLITGMQNSADIARNIHFNTMEEVAEASLSLTLK